MEGVEGVFEKPISGARNDGVRGFFKGVSQGMVGLVARPLSGALDFTSGTLNTIKRFVFFTFYYINNIKEDIHLLKMLKIRNIYYLVFFL